MSASDSQQQTFLGATDSPNTSIPLLMCDNVKSDINYYTVRLTPDKDTDYLIGNIKELLHELTMGSWMFCAELSPKKKLHYHLLVCSIFTADDVKNKFTEFLREIYTDKWKKEDGNKRMNFSVVKELPQYVKYICKDKDFYVGDDINPAYVKWASEKSFKKYSKEAFAVELQKIKDDFQDDLIDYKQLRIKIIKLKGQYGQPINLSRVSDMVLGIRIKKDPELANEM